MSLLVSYGFACGRWVVVSVFGGGGEVQITIVIIFRHGFIMASAQFGPFGEFVLRACGGHFFAEAHYFGAEGFGVLDGGAGAGWEGVVEGP